MQVPIGTTRDSKSGALVFPVDPISERLAQLEKTVLDLTNRIIQLENKLGESNATTD